MSSRRKSFVALTSIAAVVLGVFWIAPTVATAGLCGEFRWPIKSLADPDRGDIDFQAHRTRLARLYGLEPPESVKEDTPRMAPHEFRTYSVAARLVKGHIEGDSDVQFVISVPGHPNQTMAVEFLAKRCMESRFHRRQMLAARTKALEMCGPLSGDYTALAGRVRLVGVGFWGSRSHDEVGGAPNAFQLIPVLKIRGTCRQV
jgi:hypothetical protein